MIVYLHGFNSSPQSHKAQVLARALAARGLAGRFFCPQLPDRPRAAVALVGREIARHPPGEVTVVGSSLGGFYATWLAERHGARAVLLNPAVTPQADLESYLGVQRNLYTGAEYELTRAHLDEWRELVVTAIHPERYLLIVETGDELLDYRIAVAKYRGARQIIVEGGDHTLASFADHLPAILAFAGLDAPAPP
ncbi:MAG: alpha/beta fold hydrolase [Burkholderiales bacterium]|nr:alpha/beta fold hydrolase [Burkholderiales bacterium]